MMIYDDLSADYERPYENISFGQYEAGLFVVFQLSIVVLGCLLITNPGSFFWYLILLGPFMLCDKTDFLFRPLLASREERIRKLEAEADALLMKTDLNLYKELQ